MNQQLRFVRTGRLIGSSLFLLSLAACSSAPPAPIQTRTSPSGATATRPPAPVASIPAPSVAQTPQPLAAPPRAPEPAAVQSAPLRPASIESRPLETRPSGSLAPAPMAAPLPPVSSAPVLTPPVMAPPPASSLSPAPSARTEPRGTKQPYSESALADMKSAPAAAAPAPAVAAAAAASAAAASTAAAGAKPVDNEWSWPTSGRVVQSFAESSKGIALGGSPGDAVSAAAEGKVIFSGNGPRGYGNLVIVKHGNDLLSVYAHNRTLLVKEGQMVKRGQKIAEVGETGGSTPRLLFEIRQQGKPIDPTTILPRR